MPLVSVIVTTHSRPGLLPRAVESARKAGTRVEVVVVDDASTDNTPDVCRGLEGIEYVRLDRNQGAAGARNVGILKSSGEYISFLDDDDVRLPGSLDWQAAVLERTPEAGLVYGPVIYGDQDGNPTNVIRPREVPTGDVFWELVYHNFIPCPAVVFRRDCLLRVGLTNPNVDMVADWDLWVRIAELYPVAAVHEPVGIYRQPNPSSGQMSSKATSLVSRTVEHQARLLRLPRAQASPEQCRLARRRLLTNATDYLIADAEQSLRRSARGRARDSLGLALRLRFARAARPRTLKLLLASLAGRGAE